MSRSNRLLDMVFGNIIGGSDKPHSYDRFMDTDNVLSIQESDELKYLKHVYESKITTIESDLSFLSDLEELIIQLRCRELVSKEIKFAITREYIYARSLFYRKNSDIKDIRIITGKTTEYGDDMDKLYLNQNLVDKSIEKLTKSMDFEIEKSVRKLQILLIEQE